MVFRDDTLPDEMMSNGSHCNQPGSLIVKVEKNLMVLNNVAQMMPSVLRLDLGI